MRANKKNNLLDCLESLNQINDQLLIITATERQELLPLCQQMAVEIGNTIEQWEGEGTKTVELLENYCEEVYEIYIDTEGLDLGKTCQIIKSLLSQIKTEIEGVEVSPYEILFLPYKADMWDSLESVYLAASKAEDCHVTVMPIPYYNVNPQKQILSVEYEGSRFPEEIPIIDFGTYDLKENKPDAIFIHNPYDQYNYVTRVAENYFSTELIKYTDRLVYIPYFVTSQNTVASHYCLVPGVKNAWRTFVQSEGVKEGYQQYVLDKNKIVALGSPKFDKVKKSMTRQQNVPEEWQSAIEGKKVFLLNIHLNHIISKSELMLEKLSLIFKYFQENQGIALIWRPHPLSIETAKSLSPDFLQRYLALAEEFRSLGIGVYDETPDIHRAIAVSDAYIGSISSIISLYGVSGKPIFILNPSVNNIKESNSDYQDDAIQLQIDKQIIDNMNNTSESVRFLYYEGYASLEYYVQSVIKGKNLCKQERIDRFTTLQYGWDEEQSAGERIWEYVYRDITGQK